MNTRLIELEDRIDVQPQRRARARSSRLIGSGIGLLAVSALAYCVALTYSRHAVYEAVYQPDSFAATVANVSGVITIGTLLLGLFLLAAGLVRLASRVDRLIDALEASRSLQAPSEEAFGTSEG